MENGGGGRVPRQPGVNAGPNTAFGGKPRKPGSQCSVFLSSCIDGRPAHPITTRRVVQQSGTSLCPTTAGIRNATELRENIRETVAIDFLRRSGIITTALSNRQWPFAGRPSGGVKCFSQIPSVHLARRTFFEVYFVPKLELGNEKKIRRNLLDAPIHTGRGQEALGVCAHVKRRGTISQEQER